jgi:hypothetical protein
MPSLEASASNNRETSTQKARLVRIAMGLKQLRQPYDDHFRQLQEYFLPRRGNFDAGAPNSRKGPQLNDKLLNSKSRIALRTLQSGMQAGITSPARPWFRLLAEDERLRARYAVKTHVDIRERTMRQYLQSTGTYNALHVSYGDVGLMGTDCMIFDEDVRSGFAVHCLPFGMYWLGANGVNDIDTCYMEDWLSVDQVVGRFVYGNNPVSEPDWSVCSNVVKNLWDRGARHEMVHVARIITPRRERDPYSLSASNKPIASVWWEVGAGGNQLLRDSGYDRNPVIASRWYREGNQVWGSSPAMDALPDVKMLQQQERDKNEAIRRMNRPPMNAPTSMRNTPFSTQPGAINFTDDAQGVRPAFEVNPPVDQLRVDIRETEDRIDTAMFANLFMRFVNGDRRQITAREVDEQSQEKLLGIGPVLELQHREKLRPLILAVDYTLDKQGKYGETPPELDGAKLGIDYISMLAQAQKAVATGALERSMAFAGNLAGVLPEVLDNIDGDAALAEYNDMTGIAAKVIRDPDAVKRIRAQRNQQEQAKQQAELAATAGPGVKAGVEAATLLSAASDPRQPSPGGILNSIGLGG